MDEDEYEYSSVDDFQDESPRIRAGSTAQRATIHAALTKNGMYLKHLSKPHTADEGLVRTAISQNPAAFRHAAESLRWDREFVVSCVRADPRVLKYAADDFRADREFVADIVRTHPQALAYADERLRGDCLFVLRNLHDAHGESLFDYAAGHVECAVADACNGVLGGVVTVEHIKDVVAVNGMLLKFLPHAARKNPVIARTAVRCSSHALQFVDKSLRSDWKGLDLALEAVRKDGTALQYLLGDLRQSWLVAVAAMEQTSLAFEFWDSQQTEISTNTFPISMLLYDVRRGPLPSPPAELEDAIDALQKPIVLLELITKAAEVSAGQREYEEVLSACRACTSKEEAVALGNRREEARSRLDTLLLELASSSRRVLEAARGRCDSLGTVRGALCRATKGGDSAAKSAKGGKSQQGDVGKVTDMGELRSIAQAAGLAAKEAVQEARAWMQNCQQAVAQIGDVEALAGEVAEGLVSVAAEVGHAVGGQGSVFTDVASDGDIEGRVMRLRAALRDRRCITTPPAPLFTRLSRAACAVRSVEGRAEWAVAEAGRLAQALAPCVSSLPPTHVVRDAAELVDCNDVHTQNLRALRKARKKLSYLHEYSDDEEGKGDMVSAARDKVKTLQRAARESDRALSDALLRWTHLTKAAFPELSYRLTELGLADHLGLEGVLSEGRTLDDFGQRVAMEGGRHTVWRTELDGERRVLKAVPLTSSHDRRAFLREARALRRCAHPNVCPLLGVFTADGVGYLEMPFYEEGTLASLTYVPSAPAMRVGFRGLLLGLAHVHACGIAHCDVKPSNVFVREGGLLVLGDFDMSCSAAARDSTALGRSTTFQGGFSLSYVAPERIHPGASCTEIDAKVADIFSLGVTLFDTVFLDSQRPTTLELLRRREEDPQYEMAIPTLNQDSFPASLRALLRSLCRLTPSARPTAAAAAAHPFFLPGTASSAAWQPPRGCVVCMDDLHVEQGLVCKADHFVCHDCLESHVSASASLPNGFLKHGRASLAGPPALGVSCPVAGCSAPPFRDVDVALHVSPTAFEGYLAALQRCKERDLVRQFEKEYGERLAQEKRRLREEDGVQARRRHVVDQLLTQHCPQCSKAFVDFDACCALTCSACGAAFCAFCLEESPGGDAHRHVVRCKDNPRQGKVFVSEHEYTAAVTTRRARLVGEYLRSLSQPVREQVLAAIVGDLDDVGISVNML